ncbi:MAG: ABC transporter permease [Nitrospirae bacterium]|nr:ABC transporter permease [Candidatus Troglogloeales bacterium]
MNFFEFFANALLNLTLNRLRSCLTLMGVVIGVAAVISMSSIVEGGKQMTVSMIEKLGTNLLSVRPKTLTEEEQRGFTGRSKGLRYGDYDAIVKSVSALNRITPVATSRLQIRQGDHDESTMVEGVMETYMEIENYEIERGRFLLSSDVTDFKKVVVLGKEIAEKLFGATDPIGHDIKMGNQRFIVAGILAEKGALHGINYDITVVIPVTTMMKLFLGNDLLTSIVVKVDERKKMKRVSDQISAILLQRHHGVEDFSIRSQDQLVRNVEMIIFTFQVILGGTAALALLVGGIGIMNIMLVTVTERTSEIGLRMAVGASRRAILTQFLIESIALSAVGGMIGILVGTLLGSGFGYLANRAIDGWNSVILPSSVFLGFFFAVGVGVVFGLYPAYKASQMAPAEALRAD